MPPYYDLLLLVYASLPCFMSVCWCPLFVLYLLLIGVFLLCSIDAHWCYALLMLIGASFLCFVCACQCLLAMFCWCSLVLLYCVLLVFINTSLLCSIGAHQRFLVAFPCASTPQVPFWPLVFIGISLLLINAFLLHFVGVFWFARMVLPFCIFLGRCVGVKFSTFCLLHTFFSFLQ